MIKIVRQLWCRSRHTDPRKNAQAQVPHSHGATPVPRLTVSHKVLPSEDQNGIKNTSEDGDHRVVSHPVQNVYWIIVFFKSSKAKKGQKSAKVSIARVCGRQLKLVKLTAYKGAPIKDTRTKTRGRQFLHR